VVFPASLAVAQDSAGWRLKYAVTTTERTVESPGSTAVKGGGKDETTQGELVVRMTPTELWISDSAMEVVYDFAGHRTYHVHRKDGTYSESSVFADVGFREYEMQNRKYLAEVLEKATSDAGKKTNTASHVLLDTECAFGLEASPPAGGDVLDTTVESVREFRLAGETRLRYRPAEDAMPDAFRPGLRRFLTYGARIHPRIAERIEGNRFPPALLEYRVREMTSEQTVRLELRESARDDAAKPSLAGLKRALKQDSPAGELPEKVLYGEIPGPALTFEDYRKSSLEALAKKRYLDAMLVQFEGNIAVARVDKQAIRDVNEAGKDDPGLKALLAGLEEDDPKEALRLFDSIDATSLTRGYVLDIFRANSTAQSGNASEAIDLFRKALAANPRLTGVYKDLGGVLFGMYETFPAWDCWDAGRKIAPNHPMLRDVRDLEERLMKTYPRFF
jgi:hypothetical protein